MENSGDGFWIAVDKEKCELDGPYECPCCGGHIMLDATYLDQVYTNIQCPYCGSMFSVEEV